MTSRAAATLVWIRIPLLGLLGGLLVSCAGAGKAPDQALQPLPMLASPLVPDAADRAARDLAAAVLVDDSALAHQRLADLQAFDAKRRDQGQRPSGLAPYALDAQNATLPDARDRRVATRALLERRDVPKAMRTRLQEEVADDPLRLAGARIHDERVRRFGRAANALIEPVGTSITSSVLAPFRLASSLLGLAVAEHQEDPLTTRERQALAEWKEYVEQNPDDPRSLKLLGRIRHAQSEWYETQRDHALKHAGDALSADDWLLAAVFAKRALQYAPENAKAMRILREAQERGNAWARKRAHSLRASPAPEAVDPMQRDLAVALLVGDAGKVEREARALRARAPDGGFADEAEFCLALALRERGKDAAAWDQLKDLAANGDERNMDRYARREFYSAEQHPYRAFRLARRGVLARELRWLAFGRFQKGPRDLDLPRPLEWLVSAPSLLGVAASLPNRLISMPFRKVDRRAPAVWARRYLELRPHGAHVGEVRDWLEGYESGRGNAIGALELAQGDEGKSEEEITQLREAAAQQALKGTLREKKPALRLQLLREVARKYPQTKAGHEAGERVRKETEAFSPQRIRITRGFLEENPEVAGPRGLALEPTLLDGSLANGELHKEGVTLLGGRVIELCFVPAGGRDSDKPERRREQISAERMARLVAQLVEASHKTLLTDRDARFEPDPDRDLFLERARLGLLDHPDLRASASSHYTFKSMRERYGIVRSRESILPVDLVLKGSFTNLGLGAFPRIRMPKPTPDAFLYK